MLEARTFDDYTVLATRTVRIMKQRKFRGSGPRIVHGKHAEILAVERLEQERYSDPKSLMQDSYPGLGLQESVSCLIPNPKKNPQDHISKGYMEK